MVSDRHGKSVADTLTDFLYFDHLIGDACCWTSSLASNYFLFASRKSLEYRRMRAMIGILSAWNYDQVSGVVWS